MSLKNTTGREDEFLAKPEEYPNEVFKVAERLDEKITDLDDEITAKDKEIEALEAKIEALEAKIETLESRIAELEADLEEAALSQAAQGDL